MKDKEWKDYWEIDEGVSYIPWEKLNKDIDYDELEVGGMLDEDTMPEWLKSKYDLEKFCQITLFTSLIAWVKNCNL